MKALRNKPSLGQAQEALETATHELELATACYVKASERMEIAEEEHTKAVQFLNATAQAVRVSNRIVPIDAR